MGSISVPQYMNLDVQCLIHDSNVLASSAGAIGPKNPPKWKRVEPKTETSFINSAKGVVRSQYKSNEKVVEGVAHLLNSIPQQERRGSEGC